ncbi:MAG: hypothetical protein WC699_03470 [Bacteroidales bacterium]
MESLSYGTSYGTFYGYCNFIHLIINTKYFSSYGTNGNFSIIYTDIKTDIYTDIF